MNFSEWINAKYVSWRGNAVGHERTQRDFAREIGVSPSLLNKWMAPGSGKPIKKKTIDALINFFGPEAFDILELGTTEMSRNLAQEILLMPGSVQSEIFDNLGSILEKHGWKKVK